MAKEKNKPVPVRFDLKLLEVLKEEEKIDTPQQALNFLSKFWENNRPAKDGPASVNNDPAEKATSSETGSDPAPEKKAAKKAAAKAGEESKASGSTGHPSGLSGIELAIWKAEQKEKNG